MLRIFGYFIFFLLWGAAPILGDDKLKDTQFVIEKPQQHKLPKVIRPTLQAPILGIYPQKLPENLFIPPLPWSPIPIKHPIKVLRAQQDYAIDAMASYMQTGIQIGRGIRFIPLDKISFVHRQFIKLPIRYIESIYNWFKWICIMPKNTENIALPITYGLDLEDRSTGILKYRYYNLGFLFSYRMEIPALGCIIAKDFSVYWNEQEHWKNNPKTSIRKIKYNALLMGRSSVFCNYKIYFTCAHIKKNKNYTEFLRKLGTTGSRILRDGYILSWEGCWYYSTDNKDKANKLLCITPILQIPLGDCKVIGGAKLFHGHSLTAYPHIQFCKKLLESYTLIGGITGNTRWYGLHETLDKNPYWNIPEKRKFPQNLKLYSKIQGIFLRQVHWGITGNLIQHVNLPNWSNSSLNSKGQDIKYIPEINEKKILVTLNWSNIASTCSVSSRISYSDYSNQKASEQPFYKTLLRFSTKCSYCWHDKILFHTGLAISKWVTAKNQAEIPTYLVHCRLGVDYWWSEGFAILLQCNILKNPNDLYIRGDPPVFSIVLHYPWK